MIFEGLERPSKVLGTFSDNSWVIISVQCKPLFNVKIQKSMLIKKNINKRRESCLLQFDDN